MMVSLATLNIMKSIVNSSLPSDLLNNYTPDLIDTIKSRSRLLSRQYPLNNPSAGKWKLLLPACLSEEERFDFDHFSSFVQTRL